MPLSCELLSCAGGSLLTDHTGDGQSQDLFRNDQLCDPPSLRISKLSGGVPKPCLLGIKQDVDSLDPPFHAPTRWIPWTDAKLAARIYDMTVEVIKVGLSTEQATVI